MITRIVKMSILESEIERYQEIVKPYKSKILSSPGCKDVQIFKDINNKSIVFSYSVWETEQDLENYRKSEMFRKVWNEVKTLFSNPAEAWTIVKAF